MNRCMDKMFNKKDDMKINLDECFIYLLLNRFKQKKNHRNMNNKKQNNKILFLTFTYVHIPFDARSVIVIVIGNQDCDRSSNSGQS